MKIFISLLIAACFITRAGAQAPMDTTLTLTTIMGDSLKLSGCYGSKAMFVVLPVTQNADDSAYVLKLDTLCNLYAGRLKVVGIFSYEDGYADSLLPQLQQWYAGLTGPNLTILQGMYTHKTSEQQHPLFSWLTHADLNLHFDNDIDGPRQTFYINEAGDLYCVNSATAPLTVKLVQLLTQ